MVSRSPLNFSQNLGVDQGSKDGIKIGQPAIWAGQTLVGEIIEVNDNSSTIRTINDSEFRAAVFIGEKRVEAVLKGNGLSVPTLDLVPAKEEINVGDRIITSGLDKKFPRGLYLGEVSDIKKVEGQVFQEVKVNLPFQWNELEEVLIIE